ncbi:hypothetical protein GCM10011348_45740 [Marinobacterium nitratireducens]|uniref:Bacteriophage phiJL001 Gp84 C-terminal domain-containing protein n=1 Tax=Marinobacterium nitratireducens TaxID=518897 RepID=A0A918DXC4_9GAMM|nr:phage BR0599 family protein [Marinobacterium nitratireducens]GGO89004.1 hypothetical protein GCM10011348_45740 [Marinobacterium nitratireducens]
MSSYRELFRIAYRDDVWFLTSGNGFVTYNGDTYQPAPIGMGSLDYSSKVPKNNVDIGIDLQHVVAQALLIPYMDGAASVTVFTQVDGVTEQAFKGVVKSRQPNPDKLVLRCENSFAAMRDPGLKRRTSRNCTHTHYSTRGCKMNAEDFAVLAVVTALSSTGFVATVPEAANQADGWYLAGMLRASDGILRYISSHTGDQVGILGSLPSLTGVSTSYTATTITAQASDNSINDSANGLPVLTTGDHVAISGFTDAEGELNGVHIVVTSTASKLVLAVSITADEAAGASVTVTTGDSVKLYPGCDKLHTTCGSAKFNDNLDNFGGQPYRPKKNVLGGASIA